MYFVCMFGCCFVVVVSVVIVFFNIYFSSFFLLGRFTTTERELANFPKNSLLFASYSRKIEF